MQLFKYNEIHKSSSVHKQIKNFNEIKINWLID